MFIQFELVEEIFQRIVSSQSRIANFFIKFKKFAEKAFRKHFEIADHYTINATGFMFNEDKFELPNTLIFNKKGLILYYNTYEISSYTEGPKQLFLPYEEISDYLTFKPTS